MGKYDSLIDEEVGAKPAPTTPQEANYGALIDEELSSAPLHNSLFNTAGTNPDDEAKKRKLAKDLNTPAAILPNDAEEQVQLKKLDADVIKTTAPASAKFLTNEDNAKVTGLKGVDKLVQMEQAYKTYNPTNIKKYIENYTATGKPAAEAVQRLSELKKQGVDLTKELDPYARSTEDYFKDPVKSAAGGANIMAAGFAEAATPLNRIQTILMTALDPSWGKSKLEGDEAVKTQLNEGVEYWQGRKSPAMQALIDDFGKAGIADSVMMLVANPSLAVDQLSQSTPYMVPGAAAARGGAMGMASFNAFTEAADAANTARQEAIANGQTREQQDKSAIAAALVAAPLAFLGNKLTGTAAFEADFFTKGTTGQKLLQAVVKEAISGSIEEGANQLGVNVGAVQYDDSRQILEGVGKAMVIGGLLESTHAVGMTAAERALNTFVKDTENVTKLIAQSSSNAAQAVAAHDTIEELSAMTADNELRTRAPEAFQEFIETMTDDQELQEVYVDGRTVLSAIETNFTDLIRTQPELFARIQEAASLGHDVQFTVGEYLTNFAGNPMEATLLPALKSEPGGATYQEAQEFYNKQAELFQSEVQAVAEQNEPVLSREEFEAMRTPDSAYNGDLDEGLTRIFTNDEFTGDPVELTGVGFTQDEIAALEQVGQATNGTMTREQYGAWLDERSNRLKPKANRTGTYEEYVAQHNNKREVYAKDVETVEATIFNEMQKAGRFTSSVNRAYVAPLVEFYKTQAKNFGVMPSEMYAKYPLKVQAFLGLLPSATELQQYDMAAPLEGAPSSSLPPNDVVRGIAKKYAEQSGITSSPQVNYVKADLVRGKRIADEYEAMEHKPNDPEVKAAYRALIDETLAQYQLVKELGLNIEFIEQGQADPYPEGPRQAIEDIRNGHLWVFPTDSGFGSSDQQYAGNPLLEVTKEKIGDRVLLANDVFRIVHDVFGHAKDGVGFGANGEENAWQSHVRMYSPLAARAMTTETRGQNSWVNFGPFGEANRTDPRNTTYADQKTGLLPEWVSTEGIDNPNRVTPEMVGSLPESTLVNQGAAKVGQVSIRGVHYSKEQRATLNGGYYGTGIKGAEADRLRQAKDGRIKQRLYFYVDEGKGVFPEYGVGNAKHVVDLPNMYDGARNPLKLPTRNADGERDMNVFESAVIDAGFDGYYIESAFGRQGAAVLLGDASRSVKNLMGKEGYLTMDRWWVRTFNRYRGTLLTKATAKSLADFRELLGQPDLSDDETISVASTYEAKYRASGYKAKTPLNKLGNTIHRAAFGVKQTPERTSDRTFMIETTRKAKEMLARKGIDMSIADIQATLWYYEKRLYGELGARDSADISYADAARRIVALEGEYGVLSDGDVETLSERLSVGEELYQTEVGDITQTRLFKNWFGDSKVVDADGKPLVVYHGTSYDVEAFSKEFAGKTTQADNAKLGFFFTPEAPIANLYATMLGTGGQENIMPVYLSIQNPLVVEAKTLKEADGLLLNSFWKDSEYDGAILRIADGAQTVYMAREPNQIKSAVGNNGNFDPMNPNVVEQGTRGSFNLETLTVTLLQGADLSTVIHESGHFYLEMLEKLANRTDAPQQVQDDYAKTMEWFGLTSAQWAQMTIEQKRPYHEQWAESFERWNLEGQAPTQGLQPIFSRFRAWLLSVYKSVEEFVRMNPAAGKLNDEVRGVFSRLLASAEAIEATEQARAYQPLFSSAEQAGVSQNAYEDYVNLGKQATQDAIDTLQARSMRDMKWLTNARNKALKDLQATAKAARAKVLTEVTEQVTNEPIYQAMRFLRTGETKAPNGDTIKAMQGYKLDKAIIAEMFPESALDRPDVTKLRGMTSDQGLDPDIVAKMFGLPSGDALVREIATAENMRDKIQGLTDQRMLEEHGDLVDEKSLQRAADEAVHNEARAKFMATGLKMLSSSPISVTQMVKAAKQAAENVIANKRVRDVKPKQYTAAESRASKEVLKLAAKDHAQAAEKQRVALLNNRLAAAAQDAVTEVEKALRYLGKFNNESTRKNLDLDYLEQIDALLEPFDLRKGLSLSTIDTRATLAEWVQNQEAMGFEPTIDPVAMAEARQKSYKNMTMTELRGLVDTIKQIEHMGRMKKKLLTAIDKAEFAERIAEAKASMALNANRVVPEKGTPSDVTGQLGQWVRQMFASHRKFTSFMRELDGGQNNGVLFNLLVRPMAVAGNTETEMKAQAAERLATLFQPIMKTMSTFGNLYSRRRQVPGTNISMTHEQRIMFAMNWGNEGNRQRLLDGGITGKKAMSEAEAQAVLDTLTKEEWDFVQGVWDYIAEYRPLIAEQERMLTGKTPEWVEPAEVVTKFGTYKGGYFPAKYDTVLSTRSDALEAVADLRSAMKGAFGSAAARNGYTKARAAQVVGRPLLLNFNAVSRHVNEVIHRLAWQAWLVDAARVSRALDNDFRTYLGAEATKEIQDAIRDIAQGDAPATGPFEVFLNHIRTGTSIVGMGWKITTALLQPTGLAQSMSRVGGRHMTKALANYIASPLDSSDWVNEKSVLMRNRGRTMNREMNEILNTVREGKKTSAITASFFYLVGKLQRTVDIPTFIGAYERALEELQYESAVNEAERKRIEASAIAIAEQTVIDTQGGGELKDLAKVQRGSPIFKLFTNFYSYMSTVYNLNVENYRTKNLLNPSELGVFAAEALLINFVPVVMAVALKNTLKGHCDWDDMECLAQRYASEQISHVFGQMVGLREIGVSVDALTGGEAYGYTGPAGLRFFVDVYKSAEQINQGEADLALFKSVNNTLGALFHYPAGQINATVDGAIAIENGEVEGAAILPALIAGAPK